MGGSKRPPQKINTFETDVLWSATDASVQAAYEPHHEAQEAFWNVITAFLAKHGSILYEAPNFDTPHFTTGPMALQEIEVDSQDGTSFPIPSIQISSYDNDLIWGFFDKRTKNPLTRYFPPSEEKIHTAIREIYAKNALREDRHFPYIELKAKYVEFADTYTDGAQGIARRSGVIYGSRVPKVLLEESGLPIFPNTPPPNLKAYGYTEGWMRVGPPVGLKLTFSKYDPHWETEEIYRRNLQRHVDTLIVRRDAEIASMTEIADILHRADHIQLPLYDYFGRSRI